MQTQEQYTQKHQADIEELRLEITHLESEIKEAVADNDGDHDNEAYIRVLCQRRDETTTKLEKIQTIDENGWTGLKDGLQHAWMAARTRFAKILPH